MSTIETFERFFYENRGLIFRTVAYYGLTYEEIKQECMIVYFENPDIERLFLEGELTRASDVFKVELRRSVKSFSATSCDIRNNADFEREKRAAERISDNINEEVELELAIISALEIERMKRIYGTETINSVLEYYDNGSELYAEKYGISRDVARKRISRIVARIRDSEISLSRK